LSAHGVGFQYLALPPQAGELRGDGVFAVAADLHFDPAVDSRAADSDPGTEGVAHRRHRSLVDEGADDDR